MPDHPTFSIVIETENLVRASAGKLVRAIESLAVQTIPPARANEVVLLQSGDVPAAVVDRLETEYPWLRIERILPETGYYEAKMAGVARVTGDVVVFCDADCRYEPDWLAQILAPFVANPEIQVVAGETGIEVTGAYSLAVALTWGFPTFSRRTEPYRAGYYAANNVAFRRELLRCHPIPSARPVYRLQCAVHADELRRHGIRVWRQDRARNWHPLPATGARQFFLRYLISGSDGLMWLRIRRGKRERENRVVSIMKDLGGLVALTARWTARPFVRIPRALREKPGRIAYLPLSIPIVMAAVAALIAGGVVGIVRHHLLLTEGVKKLEAIGR